MTKLYHGAGSWQIPGQQEKGAARVDVPNPPADLAAWLNARRVPLEGDVLGGLVPGNQLAAELLEAIRGAPRGEPTRDPPRVAPAFLGALEGGEEFVPVSKAAEIDRLLERCPQCHHTAAAAQAFVQRSTFEELLNWIGNTATPLQLDELSDLIERKRA